MNIITKVESNTIATEVGLEIGDNIISINGKEIIDIFDYRYLIKDEYIEIIIKKQTGDEWVLEIEKDEDEDLGVEFKYPLMDCEKSCRNKCIFCFIDQNPKGMRQTIYFKDDDSRLSFLDGNFVTLTNMSDKELDRIIFYKLSPINISVHTTDPDLRVFMLKNPRASLIMEQLKKITNAGLITSYQIVLCKGINDGFQLDKTIKDLAQFLPNGKNITIVPLGLSKHRDNLPQLAPFNSDDAKIIIEQVHNWQQKFKISHGTNFAFLADEFYILANQPLPKNEEYEGYPQIENGIGMVRNFTEEFYKQLKTLLTKKPSLNEISIVTGAIAYKFLKEINTTIEQNFGIKIHTYPIFNKFYGESITVTGLLTGGDIISQLKDKPLGKLLILPKSLLRNNDDILLDDTKVIDIQNALGVTVSPCGVHGGEYLNKALGINSSFLKNKKTYGG